MKVVVSSMPRNGVVPLAGVLRAAGLDVVEAGGEAGGARDLREVLAAAGRLGADVVVVEMGAGELRLLRDAQAPLPCPLLMVADREDEQLLLAAVQIGAAGFVVREARTVASQGAAQGQGARAGLDRGASFGDELAAAVSAVGRGETVIPTRMLGGLLASLIRWSHDRERVAREADRLSARQRAVLLLLASGANAATIAAALGVSVYTVRSHVQELLRRLEVHSRAEAVLWAARTGVLDQLRREADLVHAADGSFL